MEILGTIKDVLPLIEGNNERGDYHIQPIIINVQETITKADGSIMTYDNDIIVEIVGESAKGFNLPVGTRVRVNLRFSVRDYNGRKFQKITSRIIYCA